MICQPRKQKEYMKLMRMNETNSALLIHLQRKIQHSPFTESPVKNSLQAEVRICNTVKTWKNKQLIKVRIINFKKNNDFSDRH